MAPYQRWLTSILENTPDNSDRCTSFDYRFNYFPNDTKMKVSAMSDPTRLQMSCLHLGFYLASWGMLRTSSVLLQRRVQNSVSVIEAITTAPDEVVQGREHDWRRYHAAREAEDKPLRCMPSRPH